MADVILSLSRAREIAEDWVAAWNARDLEGILSRYAEDVVFSSPTVVTRYGEPSAVLHGSRRYASIFAAG